MSYGGSLAGPGGLTKTGLGTLTFSGMKPNTNTGVIGVFRGEVDLSKTDGVDSIGPGGLSINTSSVTGTPANPGTATVKLLANEQINDNATVTIYSNGTNNIASLNLNNFTETVGTLILADGTNAGVIVNTNTANSSGLNGTLKLNGDLFLFNNRDVATGGTTAREVLITGSGTFATPTFDGFLDLGGVLRNITVSSTATLANQGPINGGGIGGAGTADNNRADATIETVVEDGGINKLGGRVLRLTNANTYAGGTFIREGAIRITNNLALGTGATQVFDGASLQVENSATGGLDITSVPLTMSGTGVDGTGALDNTGGTNIWASQITMLSNSNIGAEGASVLALTGAVTGNFSWTKVGNGTVLLAPTTPASSNYTTVTVGNGTLAFANDGTALNGRTATVNSGAGLGLFWDGNQTSEPETYAFPEIQATFLGDFGLSVNRTGLLTGQYITPANKTIQYDFSFLPTIGDQNITITNTNGYGLELTNTVGGNPAILNLGTSGSPVTPNFIVATATASNVVQGLTISAQLGGFWNITKSGAGALVLTNSLNSFTGNITINQGVLSAGNGAKDDNSQLGVATNEIILAPTAGAAIFRATDNTTFGTRRIQLANAVSFNTSATAIATGREIDVTTGKTLTLSTAFDLNGGAGTSANLIKADSGTLTLNADNSAWNGTLQISGGAVQLTNNTGAGTGAATVSVSTTSTGTATVTVTSSAGLVIGQTVTGTGITPGTVITAINTTSNAVTLSRTVATGTNVLSYGGIIVSSTTGAALQLASTSTNLTVSNPLNLNASGTAALTGGVNGGGQLENVSGTNTYQGAITLTIDSLINADANSTLHITGGIFNDGTNRNLTLGASGPAGSGGIISIDSALPILAGLNKVGSGTVFITVPEAASVATTALIIQAGTVVIAGQGNYTGLTAKGVTVNDGGTLDLHDANLDNTGGASVNRLGIGQMTLQGGTFDYTVNSGTASAETLAVLTLGSGQSHFNVLNPGSQSDTVRFTSLTQSGGSSAEFNGAFGTPTNQILFTTAPSLLNTGVNTDLGAGGLFPRILITTGGTFDFATYNTNGSLLANGTLDPNGVNSNGLQAYSAYNTTTTLDNALNTDTPKVTASMSISVSRTLNALAISGNGVTVGGLQGTTLTLTSAGVLATGPTNSNDALNVPILNLAAGEGQIHVNTGVTLSLGSAIIGTGGLTKADGGALVLASPQYYSGTTWVDGGTLQLFNGSTNSLLAAQPLIVNGGTLDLNGSAQYAGELTSVGTAAGSGGTVTSSASGTLVTTGTAAATFAGQMTNSVTFNKAGTFTLSLTNSNTYTGATVVNGGTLTLTDSGTLSGTTSIEIDNATLAMTNTGTMFVPERVNNSASVTLNAGGITLGGRGQTVVTETIGAVTLNSGLNTITVTPPTVSPGTNLTMLTLADLQHGVSQASADAMVNFVGPAAGLMGTLGSGSPRVLISSYTSNQAFMGGWAIVSAGTAIAEFAGYDKVLGVGALNTVGYAGYDAVTIPTVSPATPQNIRVASNFSAPSFNGATVVLNSLNIVSANVDFNADPTNTIALVSGGFLNSGAGGNTFGGSNTNEGNLTAGTGVAGTTTDLYLYNQAGTLTMNSRIIDNGGGSVRLIVAGNGSTVNFNSQNSYTGGTVVDGATVTFNNNLPGGDVIVNNGNLTVASGDGVASGIANTNSVTLNNSTFNFSGNSSLVNLNLNNTGAQQTQFIIGSGSTTSTLLLTGSINASPTSVGTSAGVATISGSTGSVLDLGGNSAFVVSVDQTLVNNRDVAPLQAGLNISVQINDNIVGSVITPNGIAKQGLGVLELSSPASTFSGGVDLQTGSLLIGASSTSGQRHRGQRPTWHRQLYDPRWHHPPLGGKFRSGQQLFCHGSHQYGYRRDVHLQRGQ